MAEAIQSKRITSTQLVSAHLRRIEEINPSLHAATVILHDRALQAAREADRKQAAGEPLGPLHGVPFSVKDSIDVAGIQTTAGTLGRRHAPMAERDATIVQRLRHAGGIPIAKTNLPDLLFSFESDNLIFGRTNNPYALDRTPGGSSGGESALISACGSPLGLGSDAAGSVRIPAAFCGIASLKPTSGRLPRTGHVPPAGGWLEALWQIGPMARFTEDLELVLHLAAGEDETDFTAPPVPLDNSAGACLRLAFFTDNGIAQCCPPVREAVEKCAAFFSTQGMEVEECRPPGIDRAYDLELGLLGADGAEGIDQYRHETGSDRVHPLLAAFLDQMRPFRTSTGGLAARWSQWDDYRRNLRTFFHRYDAVLSPVYTQLALKHGESALEENFRGFSYTMAWNVAGAPAATVRCGEVDGLPINVQVISRPWRDMLTLRLCRMIENQFGGWKQP